LSRRQRRAAARAEQGITDGSNTAVAAGTGNTLGHAAGVDSVFDTAERQAGGFSAEVERQLQGLQDACFSKTLGKLDIERKQL
jgi:hypothetical protein